MFSGYQKTTPKINKYVLSIFVFGVVFLLPGFVHATETLYFSATVDTVQMNTLSVGRTYPSDSQVAYKVTAPNSAYLCSVVVAAHKSGTPTGFLYAEIWSGGVSEPEDGVFMKTSGNVFTSSDLSSGLLATVSFDFSQTPGCVPMYGASDYWIVFKKQGSADLGNYYSISTSYYSGVYPWDVLPDFDYPQDLFARVWGDQSGLLASSSYNPYSLYAYGVPYFGVEPFIASTSMSLWDRTGADEFCNEAFPVSSSSWFNFSISNNLCIVAGMLVIPSSGTLSNSVEIKEALFNQFPFNWIGEAYEVYNDGLDPALVDTTSFASMSFNDLDFDYAGSSHSVDFVIFDTENIYDYIPESSMDLARNVFKWVLFFGWGLIMFAYVVKWI